jgi:hypothetical protein
MITLTAAARTRHIVFFIIAFAFWHGLGEELWYILTAFA